MSPSTGLGVVTVGFGLFLDEGIEVAVLAGEANRIITEPPATCGLLNIEPAREQCQD
jgi:hypothetical protein